MTDSKATVETLTAEVRVLMLGKRQVTLSVYRQLDVVKPKDCEPFGRIRDAQDKPVKKDSWMELPTVYVVGRCVHTDTLVRSWCSEPREPVDVSAALNRPRNAKENAEWARYKEDLARYRKWAAMPLIVLAGLR